MIINPLHWDTKHFDIRIGAVYVNRFSSEDYNKLLSEKEHFDLIYVFSNSSSQSVPLPVNTKTYYLAHIDNLKTVNSDHIKIVNKDAFDRIYELSMIAGEFSRFNVDPHFNPITYQKLYTKWVENSFSKNHYVFGYIKQDKILGMISLKFDPFKSIANIELIGVDPTAQGLQIGSKLISACKQYITNNSNLKYLTVQTQAENTLACKFYSKCGFNLQNKVNIHHVWTV